MRIKLKEFFYISNLLSISRIILAIPIAYLIKINTYSGNQIIIILAIICILTDIFDGYFSRKLNQVTYLGTILDPLADKLGIAVVLICLILYRNFPYPLVVFLLYRDLMIVIIGMFAMKNLDSPVMANFWGKLNTVIIAFTVLLFLFNVKNLVFTISLLSSYIIIFISGLSYFIIADKLLFQKKIHKYLFRLLIFLITIIVVYLTLTL
jgi:CDP-diacylglycerol--glycerol-3-phosphate 3-phosphatidyltransferase